MNQQEDLEIRVRRLEEKVQTVLDRLNAGLLTIGCYVCIDPHQQLENLDRLQNAIDEARRRIEEEI